MDAPPPHEPDGLVVETAPLSALLAEFVGTWRRGRPSIRSQHARAGASIVEPVGPYQWLATDTGIPETTLRAVRNPKRQPVTELRVAEALVASIGEPGMFYDGTLTVKANPKATPERQSELAAWLPAK